MPNSKRTDFEQEVVDALLESKAVDFEAIATIVARFGDSAARSGTEFGVLIGRRVIDACIPPDPYLLASRVAAAEGQG